MDILSLNAGELRDEVEFYTATATKDAGGGFPASTKTLAFIMPVKLMPKGSLRTYEGSKAEFTETWNVLMRYEDDRVPDESMLCKFKNDWFVIKGIEDVKARGLVLKITMVKK